jgi:hypothetical protein
VVSEHDKRAQSACAVKTHYKTTMAVHTPVFTQTPSIFIVAYYKAPVKGIFQIAPEAWLKTLRTGGSICSGLAAPPHRNIHLPLFIVRSGPSEAAEK